MEDITRFVNLQVYTSTGTFVGQVKNIILDVEGRRLDSLLIGRTNPQLVEGGRDVAVPYRWVRSFDNVMILNHFPNRVELPAPADDEVGEVDFEEVEMEAVAAR